MIELTIVGVITLLVFVIAFYQSYRDKQRWKRISSGMSLFGERENIPPLVLDGKSYDPHERRVLLIWGDLKQASFETVSDAIKKIAKESKGGKADGARIFAWDGEAWKQRK